MKQSFFIKGGLWSATLVLGLAFACKSGPVNTHTLDGHRKGWISLFNGKNLDGWHSYLQDKPGEIWKVENGAIELDPSQGGSGGDLVTNKEYGNFELELDWKISEGGNSGVIFDVHEDPQFGSTYLTGPEMQVLDNIKADDNKKANHLAGSLYDLIGCDSSTVHAQGQWNHVKIRLDKGHLTFWMNGKKVVETQMWNAQWDQLVAGSKFQQWKEFATYHSGHIALQDHGHKVWYRDIRIRTL